MSGRKVRGGKGVKRRLCSGNLGNRAEQVDRLQVTSVSQWIQRRKICVCVCVNLEERKKEVEKAGAANQERTRRPEITAASLPSSLSRATTSGAQPNSEAAKMRWGNVPLIDPTLDENNQSSASPCPAFPDPRFRRHVMLV
jgi:hypothetical protein